MVNEKYWRSKIPLWLVLLFLLNVFLIVAIELLILYPYPAEVDEAALARWDAVYEDCTIISSSNINTLTCYLVETSSGDAHLVTTKTHAIFSKKVQFVSGQPIELPESGSLTEIPVKTGFHTALIHIENRQVDVHFYHFITIKDVTTFYTILAAVMELLELGIWEIFKRNMR